jgi:hypothetical protein
MTTIADIWSTVLPSIEDVGSLQLVARLIDSQVNIAEAQLAQLKQVQSAARERLEGMQR